MKDWMCDTFSFKNFIFQLAQHRFYFIFFLQSTVNKMSPSPRPSLIPDAAMETQQFQPSPDIEKESEASNQEKNEPNKSANRARESSCRYES